MRGRLATRVARLAARLDALEPLLPGVLFVDGTGRLCDTDHDGRLVPLTAAQLRQFRRRPHATIWEGVEDPGVVLGLRPPLDSPGGFSEDRVAPPTQG